ncbi:MAG: Rrf2 family transcriptional regulator [Oscillospiraceae bacterium]|nr:Rrf2 family transcriptional regulator [Oscillospiraceae bacterium]
MYITLETDYAVRIVNCLVRHGRRMDAQTLSDKTKVTLRFSLKILRKLAAAGIVRSFKGAGGGYELAKAPEEISLNDIVETIEGVYSFCRCLGDSYYCSEFGAGGGICSFRDVYDDISLVVREKLKKATFGAGRNFK